MKRQAVRVNTSDEWTIDDLENKVSQPIIVMIHEFAHCRQSSISGHS